MTASPLPQHDRDPESVAGHWLLARIGKKVLRPGGKELSEWLVSAATVTGKRVVELAPGLGLTATLLLNENPASYVGVDSDPDAVAVARDTIGGRGELVVATAQNTGLETASADIIMGEAMLTMQGDSAKRQIVAEAGRVLGPAGRYLVHELCLVPDTLDDEIKTGIRKDLARSIRVNARPLTVAEWIHLFDEAGFGVESTELRPMALLQPRRVLADEGIVGVARIVRNLLRDADARRRVLAMRRTFVAHDQHMSAVGFVLRKR
ncbi:class I SAM-dependent methyltransferase [Dietzia sp. B32]|uniref:class I SAM-dependent methyltransferase n=1 Tax=Dietzia sp. B32 TaxID=2915130 RepID=UPI0021AE0846|nr:class I SAM-dependent methyltransferase [Dietzia sp. B32]UVE95453.1 methyltransferase domain-containing protein [Dietzia sp. B32]